MTALTDFVLPSTEEEVWRYSRIDQLDLDAYTVAPPVPVPPAGAAELLNGHVGAALATLPERTFFTRYRETFAS